MAKETVLIACRLPHGLILQLPDRTETVTLPGLHSSKLIVPHVVTAVDAEFWDAWKKVYSDYAPFKNGAIFEAKTDDQVKYKGKEFAKVKTGFEAMKPEDNGVKPVSKG